MPFTSIKFLVAGGLLFTTAKFEVKLKTLKSFVVKA